MPHLFYLLASLLVIFRGGLTDLPCGIADLGAHLLGLVAYLDGAPLGRRRATTPSRPLLSHALSSSMTRGLLLRAPRLSPQNTAAHLLHIRKNCSMQFQRWE